MFTCACVGGFHGSLCDLTTFLWLDAADSSTRNISGGNLIGLFDKSANHYVRGCSPSAHLSRATLRA